MANLINKTIGNRYKVEEFLGRGGMAEVYKVRDMLRSVNLAMKVLFPDLAEDPAFVRRFRREAKNLAALQHPNIVRFYELEEDDLLVFLTMDYIEGSTLRAEIKRSQGRPLADRRVLEVMESVCGALNYAHHMGVVHCDVKPANIMIHKNGTVLVADFGIARQAEGSTTATMASAGTPAYMAPEQVRGEDPTPQTDIYSLGIVLYEMLTGGERPFNGELATLSGSTAEKVRWEQINIRPPSPRGINPDISPELEVVVMKCLEKEPQRRYKGALELLEALRAAMGWSGTAEEEKVAPMEAHRPAETPASLPPLAAPAQKPRPRAGLLFVALAAVVLVVLGIGLATSGGGISMNATVEPTLPATIEAEVQAVALEATAAPTATITAQPIQAPIMDSWKPRVRAIDGMRMVYVPAGPFTMGNDDDKDPINPEHEVNLNEYWIDQTEVTNMQYKKCVFQGECTPPLHEFSDTRESYYDNDEYLFYPVIMVNWYQARDYCEWAGSHLPSEAEWEKAARGTDGRIYPWGNEPPNSALLNFDTEEKDTTEAGIYEYGKSPYGAYDMAGNVSEWTADWFDVYPGGDPSVDKYFGNTHRVMRGGSFVYENAIMFQSVHRDLGEPDMGIGFFGFRCAADDVP